MAYTVLLPIDTHKERWKRAVDAVANLPHADSSVEAVIFNVFEEFEASDEGAQIRSSDLYDSDEFPESVTFARNRLEERGISVSMERRHGDPAPEIIEAAEELGVDAIVMAARKRSRVGKVLFGSVAQSVILDADVPVTIA